MASSAPSTGNSAPATYANWQGPEFTSKDTVFISRIHNDRTSIYVGPRTRTQATASGSASAPAPATAPPTAASAPATPATAIVPATATAIAPATAPAPAPAAAIIPSPARQQSWVKRIVKALLCGLCFGAPGASALPFFQHPATLSAVPCSYFTPIFDMAPLPSTLECLQNAGSAAQYEDLLIEIKQLPITQIGDDAVAFISGLLSSSLGLVYTRPLLESFATTVDSISGPGSNQVKIQVGEHALSLLQEQAASFDEQSGRIREIIASAYEAEEDYSAAAKVLAGINVSSGTRKFTDEELVRHHIRLCRLYLEEDDTTSAEGWLNKAKNLMYLIEDRELKLLFALCQARILDSRRNFLVAASGYLDISLNAIIAEEERAQTLSAAIKCAILSPAGPARTRMLSRLYKDERSLDLPEFSILEKMFFDRIITPEEGNSFAETLMPHQLAKTSEGDTVVAKAIIDHNIVAVSKLYHNIKFGDLGTLIGLSEERAEETVARMIEQGRLTARLDQVEMTIYFEDIEPTGETSKKSDSVIAKEMRKHDANIQGLAEAVEKVTSSLQAQYPEFVAQRLLAA